MNNPAQVPFVPVARNRPYPGTQVPHYHCPACQGDVECELPEDGHCVRCGTRIEKEER